MWIKSRCHVSLLILLIAICLAACAPAAAQAKIVHLARTDNEPMIDAAFLIMREAYRRLGIEAVEDKLPGERAIAVLNAGEVFGDVMHFAGLEKNYDNVLRIPVPLIYFDAVVFTDGRAMSVPDWASAARHRVCIRRGIKSIEDAARGIKDLQLVNQYDNIFSMLKAGRCDIAILPAHAWLEMRRLRITEVRSLMPPLQSWPLYHHIHKSHAHLAPALEATLLQMQKSGLMAKTQADFLQRVEQAKSDDSR